MSSIAPHSLDTHVIQNSSFCTTSDLLVQQKTRARIVFLFSDCHKFSILFLKQQRLSTRTITRGLVIVTAISETWFTTYQVFTEEEQKKNTYLEYDKLVSQRVLDRTLSPRPIDAEYIYENKSSNISMCRSPRLYNAEWEKHVGWFLD